MHMLQRSHSAGAATIIALVLSFVAPRAHAREICEAIPGGHIYDERGELIRTGFDEFGYNYQARIFFGSYCDVSRGEGTCDPAYADVDVSLLWNDAWLSNRDCDVDSFLDRHAGRESYRGSGAWLVNVMHGSYEHEGVTCHWFDSTKVLAAPVSAQQVDGEWVRADGRVLGPVIWQHFAVIHHQFFDPCGAASER